MGFFKIELNLWEKPELFYLFCKKNKLFRVFRPTREVFAHFWTRYHCRWKAANFDLCSALMAIEQWGFLCVAKLLWHGASVYNGHLRGPVTLIPICFNDLGLSQLGFEHHECSNPLRHRRSKKRFLAIYNDA